VRPRTLFLTGLVLGAVVGLAFLLAGPVTLAPGLVVWTWLIIRRPRFVGASGGFIGFGAAWLLLIGQVTYSCAIDPTCLEPNAEPWLLVGAAILSCGIVLGIATRREMRQP
jgi:hypothetical protein